MLIFYWTLNLPNLGQQLAGLLQEYPLQRNRILRFLEPLGAPEEEIGGSDPASAQLDRPDTYTEADPASSTGHSTPAATGRDQAETASPQRQGVRLDFEGVTVQAAGHIILVHRGVNSYTVRSNDFSRFWAG